MSAGCCETGQASSSSAAPREIRAGGLIPTEAARSEEDLEAEDIPSEEEASPTGLRLRRDRHPPPMLLRLGLWRWCNAHGTGLLVCATTL